MVGGRVGYQAWEEFCCVWLELVCHECLGQSGIWTSFDGELCSINVTCLEIYKKFRKKRSNEAYKQKQSVLEFDQSFFLSV